jgi:flagellar biosynthesis/type III secretory pathway protein FliH
MATLAESEREEALRKYQLLYNKQLKLAWMEGYAEGRVEGYAEGRAEVVAEFRVEVRLPIIRLCERHLNRQETPSAQLMRLSLEDLIRFAEDLKEQVLKQRGESADPQHNPPNASVTVTFPSAASGI